MKELRRLLSVGLAGAALLAAGCTYRGAVYSEYNQTALDIRAQQASSAPIKVNFGYDRSVFAYVPKRNASSNSLDGEAVSVIAWNHLQHSVNPYGTGTNTLLQVDAGFISGVAAVVASAPANADVVVVPVHAAVFEPMATLAPKADQGLGARKIGTSGKPGNRIAAAVQGLATPAEAKRIAIAIDDQTELATRLQEIYKANAPGKRGLMLSEAKRLKLVPADTTEKKLIKAIYGALDEADATTIKLIQLLEKVSN